jgi:membrane-associated phospholipid phosphatase
LESVEDLQQGIATPRGRWYSLLISVRQTGPMVSIAFAYLLIVTALMLALGVSLSPDYILLIMVPIALISGRFLSYLRDWVPFVSLFLGWEAMRGIAAKDGIAPHVTDMVSMEKAISFGHIPTVVLQDWVGPGAHMVVGYIATVLYFCHFIFPLAMGMVMWLRDRVQFLRYTSALLGMALVAFVIYLLVPTAPPWYAQDQGVICCFDHILTHSLPSAVSPYYQGLNPNHFAAFPSLHAAFPFLTYLALRKLYPRASWFALGWCCMVWFSVIFLGEHYLVDVISGIAFAWGSWLVMMKIAVPRIQIFQTRTTPPQPSTV